MVEIFKPLLKNSKFLYLWASQLLSQLAINIMNFLLLVRIFTITGSTIAASLLWVSYALPAILIGPIAAASVDMVAKRRMLMITNLLQSLAILGYALAHTERFFLLFGIAFAYSFLNQFYVPAEQASLPGVVPKNLLPQAKLAFISVSFLPELRTRERLPESFEKGVVKFFSRIVEGYKFIKENRNILAPFLLLMAIQIAAAVVVVNVPVLAVNIFKISINSGGLLIVVPAGIGAIIGATAVSKLLRGGLRKKKIIETSLFLISLAILLLVFITPEVSGWVRILFGALMVMAIGASFVGVMIPSQTFLQEATPGGMRGRVFGNYWFLVTLATIVPVIFSATLTELFGIQFLFVILSGLFFSGFVVSKKYGQKFITAAKP
ncbi:MAG: Major facilitator superfamily [Candidatus Woesebacteria bacterium GW2011_GWA2_44_33]|uniref:Major facilitator superfamily n=1 Tax=Candidatus Woesebacteria bacterium GW2011_GWA2_44_33 TaxID=1618564 RepID=A0A0G1J047_9BACT|nr:MAG: Major facilitator superfamily [Candidatus Woesebacteria bacterium GW2011_GWA2_44_33]